MFERKLAAWLSRPWYDAFVPSDRVAHWRERWRREAFQLFHLNSHDGLEKLDAQVDSDEGFPSVAGGTVDFWKAPLFRHPLSGEKNEPEDWNPKLASLEDLHATCIQALTVVAGRFSNDPGKAFLWLWRKAPELARLAESNRATRLGAFWDLPPAYPNFPFSTIWQRQAAAASLASAGPCPSLLSFRSGGVQEFIGKSRTTEDYWSGSYLISFLTWQAAKVIAEELGPDAVLFPSLRRQPLVDRWLSETLGKSCVDDPPSTDLEVGSFPNGLLAIVPFDDEHGSREFAKRVVCRFSDAWLKITEDVKRKLAEAIRDKEPRWVPTVTWDKIWKRQTKPENVFELFWTITPRKEGESYGDWYRRSSRQMEARKALRDFRSTVEEGTKCHQTGVGAALTDSATGSDKFWQTLAKLDSPLQFRFRDSERLSAVSIVRRLAARCSFKDQIGQTSFPSTASIAVTPLLVELVRKPRPAELQDFSKKLECLLKALKYHQAGRLACSPYPPIFAGTTGWDYLSHVDGSWWFDESYEKSFLVKEHPEKLVSDEAEKIKTAREALKDLLKQLTPPKYYAVLVADGDETGHWINGVKLGTWIEYAHPNLQGGILWQHVHRPTSPLTHLAIMECLANLPLHVGRIKVEDSFKGKLVYAGGDDMLAFVPADYLAGGMNEYAKAFSKHFLLTPGGELLLLPGGRFMVSIAAMLVAYKTPMSGIVEEAQKLCEETAKEEYGRGCGVISLRRQSGQETVTGAKWGGSRPFEIAQTLASHISEGALSSRFISHVSELRPALEKLGDPDAEAAILRYVFTHTDGRDRETKEWLGKQAKQLLEAWEPLENPGRSPQSPINVWRELESFLLTVRFLARMRKS
jgi:CRISPR-associated protein Cmr2